MARQEDDREDLLREATGLVDRVEIVVEFCAEPVFVGFRRSGAVSLFFGQQEVYQFNTKDQLRRAFLSGRLLKAERGRLVALTRERTHDKSYLVRHPCDDQQAADYLQQLRVRLNELGDALRDLRFELQGVRSSSGCDVMGRVSGWLTALPAQLEIAQSPRVGPTGRESDGQDRSYRA